MTGTPSSETNGNGGIVQCGAVDEHLDVSTPRAAFLTTETP
ncbi:MAG TPA: hypothetical protein VMT27_08785 [Actinomycetes bacterium]|nr:hypothetical protein [Actinomycetes bacterium]